MTLHILFLTITVKKRKLDLDEIHQREMIKKIEEKNRDLQYSLHRLF